MEEQKEEEKINCDCKCIHDLGYVEIVNADGSRSQVKKEIAEKMIEQLEINKELLSKTV